MKLAVLLFILTAGNLFAMGGKQDDSATPVENIYLPGELSAPETLPEQPMERSEQVMRALAAAYPRQIERVDFRNGDWVVLLRGTWYYYAGGRLLPERLLASAPSYSPQPFYRYQRDLPSWKEPTSEEAERYRNWASNRSNNPPRRSPDFFDDLWRIHNRDESYQRVKSINFLGRRVLVHYMILEVLSLVEEHIQAAAKTDPQVQTWINNIDKLEGWTWRNIADTQSRSFHSYGLAIDIVPKSYGGREIYWLWTSHHRADWWNVPYSRRYHPPDAVIKVFERFGFVWGGKWPFFDTIHFEYRPEILFFSGMPPDMQR